MSLPLKGVLIFKNNRWVHTDGSDPTFEELMDAAVALESSIKDAQEWRYHHSEIEAACGGETALNVRNAVMKRRERILAEIKS